MTERVYIVWNEAMTQGIVLKNIQQVNDLKYGICTEGDLTECFVQLHGIEIITVDSVLLENKT
jgi:hypothetical protein